MSMGYNAMEGCLFEFVETSDEGLCDEDLLRSKSVLFVVLKTSNPMI